MSRFSSLSKNSFFLSRLLVAFYFSILDYITKGYGFYSAAISYYMLMSIVPLFIVLTVILSFISSSYTEVLSKIVYELFPSITKDFLKVIELLSEKRTVFGIISFIIAFYFASSIFTAIHTAIVYIFENPQVSVKKKALIYILGIPIFITALFIIYILSFLSSFLLDFIYNSFIWEKLLDTFGKIHLEWIIKYVLDISKIINFITFFIILESIYIYFPPVEKKDYRIIFAVSVVVAVFLVLLKMAFNVYIEFASKTNPVYGSLSGIFAFLAWLYLSFSIILIGGRALFYLYKYNQIKYIKISE